MKKLMVLAAVAIAAVAANAATLKWGSTTAIEGITSGTKYLVWCDAGLTTTGLDKLTEFNEATITSFMGGTLVGESSAYSSSAMGGSTVVKPNDPVSGMAQGQHKFYSIVIAGDGKTLAYTAASQAPIMANETTISIAKAGTNFTVVAASAAPEPTSGLMLLLGVGLMALKRKRA